jgi:hypothetical protein
MARIYEIHAPEYQVTQEQIRGYESAGKKIDGLIATLFGNKHILMRGFSSEEHKTSLDAAVDEIIKTGWDRNGTYEGKGYSKVDCDLFAWEYTPDKRPSPGFPLWKSWEANVKRGNHAFRWDVLVVYDPDKMSCIPYEHKGRVYHDAFCFQDPDAKKDAVLAVIKLTD